MIRLKRLPRMAGTHQEVPNLTVLAMRPGLTPERADLTATFGRGSASA